MKSSTASTITLVFAGDTSLGEKYLEKRFSKALKRVQNKPHTFYEKLAPLIGDKDHLIANLETVLTDDPLAPIHPDKLYCYADSIARSIEFMKDIKVDAVSLGNNHAMDRGEAGLRSTMSALTTAGIDFYGAGANRRAAERPLRLGDVHVVGGYQTRKQFQQFGIYANKDRPGVNQFGLRNPNRMSRTIERVRRRHPNAFIIATPHWSLNYGAPGAGPRRAFESMIEAGADLVLGHGTHNLQTWLRQCGRTSVFSLGNFVFNSPGRYAALKASPFSAIARLTLRPCAGKWEDILKLYPIVSDNRLTRFRPRPVDEAEARQVFAFLASQEPDLFESSHILDKDERGWFISTLGH